MIDYFSPLTLLLGFLIYWSICLFREMGIRNFLRWLLTGE